MLVPQPCDGEPPGFQGRFVTILQKLVFRRSNGFFLNIKSKQPVRVEPGKLQCVVPIAAGGVDQDAA